jgi:hypothetical protein
LLLPDWVFVEVWRKLDTAGAIPESRAIEIATPAAKKYCLDRKHPVDLCNKLEPYTGNEIMLYGPTDGDDEYFGDWLISFSPPETATNPETAVIHILVGLDRSR